MKPSALKLLPVLAILLKILPTCYCGVVTKREITSLTDDCNDLTEDVKFFFRSVGKFAGTIEQLLPNITTDVEKTRSYSEHTRVTFLMGVRHLLVGVREIAITFEHSFNTDHIKQLHQLKNVTNFVKDLLTGMKMWCKSIRGTVAYLLRIYNRYIPEVLFGKCLGNYLFRTYPESSYYEYPFILLSEIYSTFVGANRIASTEVTELSTELPISSTDRNIEQNEISHSPLVDYKKPHDGRKPRQSADIYTESPPTSESFFDFNSVLIENKDEIIDNAVNQHTLQICLKLYTVESISRSLKIYFLA